MDPKTLTLKARARYENPNGKLKPGISASIQTLIREIPDAIVIPSISSITELGRDIVYVYRNGVARVEITKDTVPPLRCRCSPDSQRGYVANYRCDAVENGLPVRFQN